MQVIFGEWKEVWRERERETEEPVSGSEINRTVELGRQNVDFCCCTIRVSGCVVDRL